MRCRSELGPARVRVLLVLLAHRAGHLAADFGEGGDGGGEAFFFRRFGDLLDEQRVDTRRPVRVEQCLCILQGVERA